MQVLRIQTPPLFVITRMSSFPSPTDAQDRRLVTGGKNLFRDSLPSSSNRRFSLPLNSFSLASNYVPIQSRGSRFQD